MDIYSSKVSPALDFGAGAFLLVIAVLSIVGNLLILVMASKRSNHMKPPELLSVNLAVTDLGAAVTMYPLAVASSWNHHWIGGHSTCYYYGFMGFFLGVTSIATLMVMAIIRFSVSVNIQAPKEKVSKRCVKMLVAGTWLYALLWAVLPFVGWGEYGPEPFGLSCTLAWGNLKTMKTGFSMIICMLIMNLVIPAVIIIFCYSAMAVKLYLTYKSIEDCQHIPSVVRLQRRLMIIAVLISLGFIGCWTPYAIVSLWSTFHDSASIPPVVSMLPCLFAKSSTVYNPLIYYAFSKPFKHEVKQLGRVCGWPGTCDANMANQTNANGIYLVSTRSNLQNPAHVENSALNNTLATWPSFDLHTSLFTCFQHYKHWPLTC
uniref:G-protein coupled receptors family 1 profile domain-containing protein n=1 Tax=Denticeps clupeoides TaxID=299321 RepID=A0AAY4BI15_9TELE